MSGVGSFICSRAYVWDEGGRLVVTNQKNAAGSVRRIVEMMSRLLTSKGDEFSVRQGEGRKWIEKTKLGDEILVCLKFDLSLVSVHFPSHRISPLFTLFKRFFGRLRVNSRRLQPSCVFDLNKAVEKVRHFAKGGALGKRLGNLKRAERQNASSCKFFMNKLRSRYSKLLAVRLDLGYISEFCPGGGIIGKEITLQEAQVHRDKFFRELRKGRIAGYLAGYIWKVEYALEKGYHFHVAIFFDGQHRCSDIILGDIVGKYWKEVVTDSKGMYFNCNKRKEDYARCGIGMVNRSDEEKWSALGDAVRYLTKVDLYLRFIPSGNARTFGVGGPYGGVTNSRILE